MEKTGYGTNKYDDDFDIEIEGQTTIVAPKDMFEIRGYFVVLFNERREIIEYIPVHKIKRITRIICQDLLR